MRHRRSHPLQRRTCRPVLDFDCGTSQGMTAYSRAISCAMRHALADKDRLLDNAKVFHRISLSASRLIRPLRLRPFSSLRAFLWHNDRTDAAPRPRHSLRAGAPLPSSGWNISPNCSRPAAGAAFTAKLDFLENIQEAKDRGRDLARLLTREASPDNPRVDLSWLGQPRVPLPQATRDRAALQPASRSRDSRRAGARVDRRAAG